MRLSMSSSESTPEETTIIAGKRTESKVSFYFAGTCAIAGMMCLRLFILYAGQMNTIVWTR